MGWGGAGHCRVGWGPVQCPVPGCLQSFKNGGTWVVESALGLGNKRQSSHVSGANISLPLSDSSRFTTSQIGPVGLCLGRSKQGLLVPFNLRVMYSLLQVGGPQQKKPDTGKIACSLQLTVLGPWLIVNHRLHLPAHVRNAIMAARNVAR